LIIALLSSVSTAVLGLLKELPDHQSCRSTLAGRAGDLLSAARSNVVCSKNAWKVGCGRDESPLVQVEVSARLVELGGE